MRPLAVFTVLMVSALVSLFAGLRARYRVRKMMREDAEAGPGCAIDRPEVQAFFSETQILRASVEDIIENPAGLELAHDEGLRTTGLERLFGDWKASYERLADEDKHALESHGVTQGRVESAVGLTRASGSWHPKAVRELRDLEGRMSTGQAASGYR